MVEADYHAITADETFKVRGRIVSQSRRTFVERLPYDIHITDVNGAPSSQSIAKITIRRGTWNKDDVFRKVLRLGYSDFSFNDYDMITDGQYLSFIRIGSVCLGGFVQQRFTRPPVWRGRLPTPSDHPGDVFATGPVSSPGEISKPVFSGEQSDNDIEDGRVIRPNVTVPQDIQGGYNPTVDMQPGSNTPGIADNSSGSGITESANHTDPTSSGSLGTSEGQPQISGSTQKPSLYIAPGQSYVLNGKVYTSNEGQWMYQADNGNVIVTSATTGNKNLNLDSAGHYNYNRDLAAELYGTNHQQTTSGSTYGNGSSIAMSGYTPTFSSPSTTTSYGSFNSGNSYSGGPSIGGSKGYSVTFSYHGSSFTF